MERKLLRVIRGLDCGAVTSAVGTAYFDTGTSVIVKRAEGTGWAGVPQEAGTSAAAARERLSGLHPTMKIPPVRRTQTDRDGRSRESSRFYRRAG